MVGNFSKKSSFLPLHVISLSPLSLFSELPYNDYFEYFGPDFKLHISPTNMTNQNTLDYLNKIKARLFENLRLIPHAPSVQMQREPIESDFLKMYWDLFIVLVFSYS